MNTLKTRKTTESPVHRIAGILAVSALAWGLAACDKEQTTVQHNPDPTVENTRPTEEDRIRQGAARAESSAKQAASAAAGTLGDAAITAQVHAGLLKDPDLSAVKIEVKTVDGKVTLDGPAPSTTARDRAEIIAKAVTGVTMVSNQLVVTAY